MYVCMYACMHVFFVCSGLWDFKVPGLGSSRAKGLGFRHRQRLFQDSRRNKLMKSNLQSDENNDIAPPLNP